MNNVHKLTPDREFDLKEEIEVSPQSRAKQENTSWICVWDCRETLYVSLILALVVKLNAMWILLQKIYELEHHHFSVIVKNESD